MKRRFLALMLVSAMAISCMTGCNDGGTNTATSQGTEAMTTEAATEAQGTESPVTTEEETKAPETEAATTEAPVTEAAQTEAAETTKEETTAEPGAAKPTVIEDFMGFYSMEDGSELAIYKDGTVHFSIFRLADLWGSIDAIYDGVLDFNCFADTDQDVDFTFDPSAMSVAVQVSDWEYLNKGDVFYVSEDTEFSDTVKAAAGTYTSDDSSELIITEDGNVDIGIFRLCSMDGKIVEIDEEGLYIVFEDPSGEELHMLFNPETGVLEAVNSTWDYIADGDSFTFTK